MPPTLGDRLEHIIESIDNIHALLESTTVESLAGNRIQRMALEREFEIICEASRHVPDVVKSREQAIDWGRMTDLGNRLRHAYHAIDLDILLGIARNDLPPLKSFVRRVLAEEGKQ